MKSINKILGLLLLLISCVSCEDDFTVDLADRGFVRLNKPTIALTLGEKYLIKAYTDTLGSDSKELVWSVLNPEVASIEAGEDNTAIVTGLREGDAVIQVESKDGSVKYFSQVSVSSERVIKILAIGNSFSEDAIENYLYDFAKAAGHKVLIANMYIGGSSLETHWTNASDNRPAYHLRVISPDGSKTAFNDRTIEEAVSSENWDYISFQQVSQLSGIADSYKEYLPQLLAYTKPLTTNPDLKYILHQTWAYAADSDHFGFPNYDKDQMKMYQAIVDAVSQAKAHFDIDMVVPAGTAIQNGRTSYIGDRFTRDGYHLNLGIGRFTAAAAWFETLFGNILSNSYAPEGFSTYDVDLVKAAAAAAVAKPKEVTVLTDFQSPPPNEFELTAPIFVDFGGVDAGAPFNFFRHPNDMRLSGLRDSDGVNSEFAIEVSQPFSGTLDRPLQNILGFPQAVSQDMFFTDGIHIAQSGFRVSNLNKNEKYTFVFYGAINDDKSETQYTVIGKNQGSGILDNDYNLGKLVVIKDIEPMDDASITIQMTMGPNNEQFAKFFGINAMMILPEGMDVPVPSNTFNLEKPVYIDFGGNLSDSPFNNFDELNGVPLYELKDADGTNTNFAINITDRFVTRNNNVGAETNTLGLPNSVVLDAFYGDKNNATAGFTIYNLNKNQDYQFIFYGSRRGVSDNRDTRYLVKGTNEGSATLNTSNNASNVAKVNAIRPAADGTVEIVISAGPNNTNPDGFYYINAMMITPIDYVFP